MKKETTSLESLADDVQTNWKRVVRRRSFLRSIGAAGALLRFAAAIETVEADLWQQYNELGGQVDHNDNQNPGNPAYVAALKNLDGDMPQYISDNTDDEISHRDFLNAYLKSKGAAP